MLIATLSCVLRIIFIVLVIVTLKATAVSYLCVKYRCYIDACNLI